jgi:hypothetical protein
MPKARRPAPRAKREAVERSCREVDGEHHPIRQQGEWRFCGIVGGNSLQGHHMSPRVQHHSPTTRPPSAGARRDGSSAVSDRALRISALSHSGLIFSLTVFEFRDAKFSTFVILNKNSCVSIPNNKEIKFQSLFSFIHLFGLTVLTSSVNVRKSLTLNISSSLI